MKVPVHVLVIAGACLLSIAGKPAKTPPLRPAPVFFKSTGEPFELEKPFPGITAALMLSDEQKIAVRQAHEQTVRNPLLRNSVSALERKGNPTPAERQALQEQMQKAQAELRSRVDVILSPQQKALAERIQDAAIASEHEANEFFEREFAAAGADPVKSAEVREKARVEAEDLLVQKLEKFLTPAQMQAIQRSATEQHPSEATAIKK